MHIVAVLALHGVTPFDLAIPCEVFSHVTVPGLGEPYAVRVCGEASDIRCRGFDLRVPWGLGDIEHAHTVVVPGIYDPTRPIADEVLGALRGAAARGARIASICTGAFVLAAAGLLDGLRATTHWHMAGEFAARYPRVRVEADVLFVDEGRVLTSAGAAAGLDLCLHMVRLDHGAAAAAHGARLAVMPLERDGSQAQYIAHAPPGSSTTLAPLLAWIERHLDEPLALDDLARRAHTSVRTLSRRFKQQTGTTPHQWISNARVRRAQEGLETTRATIEEVATQVGFESAAMLREHFRRVVGVSPTAYRRAAASAGPLAGPGRVHASRTAETA